MKIMNVVEPRGMPLKFTITSSHISYKFGEIFRVKQLFESRSAATNRQTNTSEGTVHRAATSAFEYIGAQMNKNSVNSAHIRRNIIS